MKMKKLSDIKSLIKKFKYKKQIILICCYLTIAFGISFIINKSYSKNYYSTHDNLSFSEDGGNLVSDYFDFPESVQKLSVTYGSTKDTVCVINVNNKEIFREKVEMAPAFTVREMLFSIPEDTNTYYITFENVGSKDFEVYNVEFLSTVPFNNDGIIKSTSAFIIMLGILLLILFYRFGKLNKHQVITIVVLLGAVFYVSGPMLMDYLPRGHDLWGHCGRIEGMKEALKDGQIMPVIIPSASNHFGILSFVYPELFLYLPAFLRLSGASMVLAYQYLILFINLLTVMATYISVKSVLKDMNKTSNLGAITSSAVISTIVYLMSVYRLTDVYVRAAIGESLAMAFFPLVVAGCYHIFIGNSKKWYLLTIGLCGIIQSHVLSCFIVVLLILFLSVPFIKEAFIEKRWSLFLRSVAFTFILNLWYIVPFVKFVLLPLNTKNLINNYVSYGLIKISNLFVSNINVSYEDNAEFITSLGVTGFIVLALVIVYIFEHLIEKDFLKKKDYVFIVSITSCILFLIFINSEYLPHEWIEAEYPDIWKAIQMLQFPYRFLSIASIGIAFLLGIILVKLGNENQHRYYMLAMVVVIVFSIKDAGTLIENYKYNAPETIIENTGNFIAHLPKDYLPAGVDEAVFKETNPYIESGNITCYERKGTNIKLSYESERVTNIVLPLFYYPCYRAVDENETDLQISQNGDKRLLVKVPKGNHTISIDARYLYSLTKN